MFKGNKNLVVGLFVSVAIAGFLGFVIWLTGRTGVEETERYTLLFKRDISGLAMGGPVKYMGVNVGSVVQMNLRREEGIVVRVDIEVLESTPIDQGTYASLTLQGITGVAVINLASEPGEHPPLKSLPGKEYPVIPVRDVGFAAVISSAPEIMAKLENVLKQAGRMLGEENQQAISGTLAHIETVTGSLAQSRESISELPKELANTLREAERAVAQFRTAVGELQPGLKSTVENIRSSSEHLAALTGRLDTLLAEHEADMSRFLDEGLAEAPALMNETRSALREVQKLLRELQDDPSQLIHRPEPESLEVEP